MSKNPANNDNMMPDNMVAGLILSLHAANERWHYKETASLIGWVQT